jgi:hypothetical protein
MYTTGLHDICNTATNRVKSRLTDMGTFLREQPTALTEYDEPLNYSLIRIQLLTDQI